MSADATAIARAHAHAHAHAHTSAPADAARARRCAGCDYDLRGLEHNRCPECGLEFDPHFLPPADIPWLKRSVGDAASAADSDADVPFVAYWKTVFLVLFRPRKFGHAVWHEVEVDAAEAARFRWITIGLASGSFLAATVLAAFPPLLTVILAPPVVLYFWMATGRFDLIHFVADRYVDEARYHRLHEMSCAGLALAPLVPALLLLAQILNWPTAYAAPRALALAGVVMLAWWYGSLRFALHGGRCSRGDAVLHAVLLPFAWFMIATVICLFAMGIAGLFVGILG